MKFSSSTTVTSIARQVLFAAASLAAVAIFAATPIVVATAKTVTNIAQPLTIEPNEDMNDLGSMTIVAQRAASTAH